MKILTQILITVACAAAVIAGFGPAAHSDGAPPLVSTGFRTSRLCRTMPPAPPKPGDDKKPKRGGDELPAPSFLPGAKGIEA